MELPELLIDERTYVLVLTGAGVSAESGLSTFRGMGGMWDEIPVTKVASPSGFAEDPDLVWRFYAARREQARGVTPNAGHQALVALEKKIGDRFLLATQNVDGLHQSAGSERVIELHGNILKTRCFTCDRQAYGDATPHSAPPACDLCAAAGRTGLLRPAVVWFGESLDGGNLATIDNFLKRGANQRLVFLAAGTSGAVYPAAAYVDVASRLGAETWLVNAEPADNTHRFSQFVQGKSGEVLPRLFTAR